MQNITHNTLLKVCGIGLDTSAPFENDTLAFRQVTSAP